MAPVRKGRKGKLKEQPLKEAATRPTNKAMPVIGTSGSDKPKNELEVTKHKQTAVGPARMKRHRNAFICCNTMEVANLKKERTVRTISCDEVERRVANLESDVANLESDVQALSGDMQAVKAKLAQFVALQQRGAAPTQQHNDLPDGYDINYEVDDSVSCCTVEEGIKQLMKRVKKKGGLEFVQVGMNQLVCGMHQSNYIDVEQRIANLERDVQAVRGDVQALRAELRKISALLVALQQTRTQHNDLLDGYDSVSSCTVEEGKCGA